MLKNGTNFHIIECIGRRSAEIIDLGECIYKNPETGFKEFKASGLVADKLCGLGLSCMELGNIPGVKATIDTGRPGPAVAVLSELDAVICPEHPNCSMETGAAHACGHNIQVAAMIGAAIGLLDSGIYSKLSGKIHFIAVPAEEYIEISYRLQLKEKGIIKYLGGKPEFVYRGLFDDVDMCVMVHAYDTGKKFSLNSTWNGCIAKRIKYIGKASHAGARPHEGINALYAANLGIMAINFLRETFREDDYIRVHPIITKGGDTVSVIPCEVKAETLVRGKTMESILRENKKINQALAGGAVAMGAKVEIEDIPGYFPLNSDHHLNHIARNIMIELEGESEIGEQGHTTASTDMGDLSTLMPVIQPFIGGVEGGLHSSDFKIINPHNSYILGAEFLACTAAELLWDRAEAACSVLEKFHPVFCSKQEYFKSADMLFSKMVMPEYDTT